MEVIFKFKKEIFGLVLAGIIMLMIAYLLAPDKGEQIIDTLRSFGALLIIIPFLLIILIYIIKERANI